MHERETITQACRSTPPTNLTMDRTHRGTRVVDWHTALAPVAGSPEKMLRTLERLLLFFVSCG